MDRRALFLVFLLVFGVAASGYVGYQRMRVEARNRAVDIVVDYDEASEVAAASGKPVQEVLASFKNAGATAVAITEMTVADAVHAGLLIPDGRNVYLVHPEYAGEITEYLQVAVPGLASHMTIGGPVNRRVAGEEVPYQSSDDYCVLQFDDSVEPSYLMQIPLGISLSELQYAKAAGLEVVGRLVNYTGATPGSVDAILSRVSQMGIKKVVFFGDQALGYNGIIEDTAKSLLEYDLVFGRLEFSKQKGELLLAKKAESNVAIVHSVSTGEMVQMSLAEVIERFQRGVRERGVRMCYVRLYETTSPDLLETSVGYIQKITRSIIAAGYAPASSHGYDNLVVPDALRAIAGLGVAAGAMLLLISLVQLSAGGFAAWFAIIVALCCGLSAWGLAGQKVVGLLSAIVFPTLACVLVLRGIDWNGIRKASVFAGIARLIYAILIACCGGLLIVGLLSDRDLMLRIDQFLGVKAAHFLPILILAIIYGLGAVWTAETWAEQKRRMCARLRELAANPLMIWQAIAVVAVAVIILMMVSRSGNDAAVEVSPLELKFRAILDKALFVRPRTKEFLVGYPLMFVGIMYALRGYRQWAAPLVVVGAVGVISALNTFCHIHTPIFVSVIRVVNGAVVGTIIGLVLYRMLRDVPEILGGKKAENGSA